MYGEIKIPCKVDIPWSDKVDDVIIGVTRPMSGDAIDFRVILKDEGSVAPEFVKVDGMRLTEYDKFQLYEWYKSYNIYKEKGKTEYFFEENGDEYWYQTNDFKKHYTKIEG